MARLCAMGELVLLKTAALSPLTPQTIFTDIGLRPEEIEYLQQQIQSRENMEGYGKHKLRHVLGLGTSPAQKQQQFAKLLRRDARAMFPAILERELKMYQLQRAKQRPELDERTARLLAAANQLTGTMLNLQQMQGKPASSLGTWSPYVDTDALRERVGA